MRPGAPYSVMVGAIFFHFSGIELIRRARREYPQLDGVFCLILTGGRRGV